MKKKQLKNYCAPTCSLVHVESHYLMQTSFPSQHNPGQHKPGPAGAKASMGGWEEAEEEEISSMDE